MIRHIEGTRFTLGTPDGEPQRALRRRSRAALRAAGLKAPVEPDLRAQIWLKLIGNAAFNPLTTVTRSTMGGARRPRRTPRRSRAR